ncbi:class I SAM-dependent methyltransferase [uncultured Pseudodesulfovibrio sp.]|uniref:class I SAM-dependent methyltransferase n=1 Tax=uncultured Pseudodesulfovibrio sp. TaxID=2035858 RepID=UPI0029C7E3B8|nr:class I SAM-dependent methyltransferase [uncultured Pseudodesulfovibrio sp.]
MHCRFCKTPIEDVVVDLGTSPLSNAYVTREKSMLMEPYSPLKAYFCPECGLVQLDEFASPEDIFSEYDYFSSYSETWLAHAREYVDYMVANYDLGPDSHVVEIASNDGYLLQYFVERGIPALGVEPAANVAAVAREKGIPTECMFFGRDAAEKLKDQWGAADLVLGNNVLAHVPDINDFVAGFAAILKEQGIMTVEFPHLLNLVQKTQFDTIYHEHFSYLSLYTVQRIFKAHGLTVFDVQELPTHGGSLRVCACPEKQGRSVSRAVGELLGRELDAGLDRFEGYREFSDAVQNIKMDLLSFLIDAKRKGATVAGYGAAAKGNTLLNYAGIRPDFISMVADKSPYKQGKYLPGSRIPIVPPETLLKAKPDYVLILPWNIRGEIMDQLAAIREWGGKFVTAIPNLRVWE